MSLTVSNLKTILLSSFFCVITSLSFSQPVNDNCATAEVLCDMNPVNGLTTGATNEIGPNAADGPSATGVTCFPFEKTVWYSFTTNSAGGDVTVNVTNVNCVGAGNGISGLIYQANTPCDNSTYSVASNCESNSGVGFSLNALGLAPNTTYYVLISSGRDCSFDLNAQGPGFGNVGPPSVNLTSAPNGLVCEQTPILFTATPTNCASPIYNWTLNGATVQTGTSNTYTSNQLQNGDDVEVQILCSCGPGATSNTVTITAYPNVADAGPDQAIPYGTSTQLQGSGGMNPTWSPSAGLSNTNTYNPTAAPKTSTIYYLTVTDANGCTFTDSVMIMVVDSITVPNTFTPNSDGVNDTWEILNIENFPKVKITVYDRWGQEVYKTIGYPPSKRWDGTKGGKKLPASTYYYVINLSIDAVEERLVKGSVSIIY